MHTLSHVPLSICGLLALLAFVVSCGDSPSENNTTPAAENGTQNGECYGNQTCNYGLLCSDQNLCEIIPGPSAGERGGACLSNGSCDTGLACNAGNLCLLEDSTNPETKIGEEAPIEVDENEIIVGEVNWENIHCDPDGVGPERWACSVGYLSINSRSRCTAWLVGPSVIATNNHCIASQSAISQVIATFNFEQGVSRNNFDSFICEDFLATSPELDLTLIGCSSKNNTPPGDTYGWFEIDFESPIRDDEELAIIHQNCIQGPLGCAEPSERPDKKLSLGRVLLAQHTPVSFRHSADTLGGSSGSPVIDANTGKVRGIHFAGVKSQGFNVATAAQHFLGFKSICDVLQPGNCAAGEDRPPGDTRIQFRTFEAFTGEEFTLFVRPGTDPNASEEVQTRCFSTGDSNIPQNAPFRSPWGDGGAEVETTVVWSTPGAKEIQCTTFERDEDSSSTVVVIVNVQPGNTPIADNPPTAPEIALNHDGELLTGLPIQFFVVGGADPEGMENVQTQCFSEGSNWTENSPFATPLDRNQRNGEPSFVWNTPGSKTIACVAVEEDGQASPLATMNLAITEEIINADNPPSAPIITVQTSEPIADSPVVISVVEGADPEGIEEVQTQCFSAGSNWTDANPFASELSLQAQTIDIEFVWTTPGSKTIVCFAVEADGQATQTAQTIDIAPTNNGEDPTPTQPTIIAQESTQTNLPTTIEIQSGQDPTDLDAPVRVQCISEGSEWISGAEFASDFGPAMTTYPTSFTWDSPGQKTIFCATIKIDGSASPSASTTILVQ